MGRKARSRKEAAGLPASKCPVCKKPALFKRPGFATSGLVHKVCWPAIEITWDIRDFDPFA